MGYVRNKTYVLVFPADDEEYAGLEVRTKGASVGQVLGLLDLVRLADVKDLTQITPEDRRELERLFRLFCGCPAGCDWAHEDQGGSHYVTKIRSWNLQDEDAGCVVDVPADYTGFMAQDMEFQMALVFAWLDAVVGTPGELGKASTDGGQFPEGSIPMATLSSVPQLSAMH